MKTLTKTKDRKTLKPKTVVLGFWLMKQNKKASKRDNITSSYVVCIHEYNKTFEYKYHFRPPDFSRNCVKSQDFNTTRLISLPYFFVLLSGYLKVSTAGGE